MEMTLERDPAFSTELVLVRTEEIQFPVLLPSSGCHAFCEPTT